MLRKTSLLLFYLFSFALAHAQDVLDKSLLMDYLQEQQYNQMIRYLTETVNVRQPNGLSLLANAYAQNGQPAKATATYERILALDTAFAPALQYLGDAAMNADQDSTAMLYFTKLHRRRPGNAAYNKQLGRAWLGLLSGADSAFFYFGEAYRLNPQDVSVAAQMGLFHIGRKNYAQADSILKAYLAVDSTQETIYRHLLTSAFSQEKYAEAAAYGERLLDMRIAHPVATYYTAIAYYRLKQYDSCIQIHHKMTGLLGDATETVKYAASLGYAGLRRYDEANGLLEECIALAKSKHLDTYYTTLAENFEQMRQFRRAIAHYDTAYFLFRNPMRQYGIARIYDQHLQDFPRAKKFYEQYFKNANAETRAEKQIREYVKERMKTL
ncbi:tetratricopeptide repeat protein [Chitinophaga lutea]